MKWSGKKMMRRCAGDGGGASFFFLVHGVMGDTSTWKKTRKTKEDESSLRRFLFYSKKIYVHM